jgi:23S rRNA (adenine2503-C2)-methyltransferase
MLIPIKTISSSTSQAPEVNKVHLLGMNRRELEEFAGLIEQPAYRGRQLYRWLYTEREPDVEQMSDLPATLRRILADLVITDPLKVIADRSGFDGSRKLLFETADGERVESVLIPEGERLTACLSSQVGCVVGCKFCATGLMGFRRNLTTGEIVAQLFGVERAFGRRMTNVVMMGMGEPLLNRNAVFKATSLICDPEGVGISRKHFTISTAGWLPGIRAMVSAVGTAGLRTRDLPGKVSEGEVNAGHSSDERQSDESARLDSRLRGNDSATLPKVKLAISLNCTSDEARHELMPLAARYQLKETLAAAADYAEAVGMPFAVSYLLLAGATDSLDDATRLVKLLKGLHCKVNVMEYNDVGAPYQRASREQAEAFFNALKKGGLTVTMRTSRGGEIAAACGQLAGEYQAGSGVSATKGSDGEVASSVLT